MATPRMKQAPRLKQTSRSRGLFPVLFQRSAVCHVIVTMRAASSGCCDRRFSTGILRKFGKRLVATRPPSVVIPAQAGTQARRTREACTNARASPLSATRLGPRPALSRGQAFRGDDSFFWEGGWNSHSDMVDNITLYVYNWTGDVFLVER